MLIHAEIVVTPDSPTVQFREPKEQVNLDIELPKILNAQGWGLGTYFHVQFINHDRTKLIASGDFLVTENTESLHTANPEGYQPMTKTISARKAAQIGDWFYPNGVVDEVEERTEVDFEKIVKWNPGKKVHEVIVGDEVLFASAVKTEAEKFRDAA
ncbi:hypothetical protein LCGC14_1329480 [marine sediment metagenome]|uniref:Uncharacterized protein n=1 Tax=marine sediment metagenome TaxID=412755 RepID=A0A0F9MXW1_9ZZZZ